MKIMNVFCSMAILLPVLGIGFGDIFDSAKSSVQSLASSVTTTTSDAVGTISGAASALSNTTAGALSEAEDALSSSANEIVSSAQSSLNQMQSQVTSLVNSAVDTVKATSATAISETQSAISSAVSDMQAKASELQDTTVSAVNAAAERVKSEVNGLVDTIDNLSAQMCESQCTSFFNLPCFLLFRCTDKIRNFCLAILLPILIVIVVVIGCNTGLISFPCLCKALKYMTCIPCIAWLINRSKKNKEETAAKEGRTFQGVKVGREDKLRAKAEQKEAKVYQKETDNPEEDCPQTEKNMHVRDQL